LRKVIVADISKCYACLACVLECSYRRAGADAGEAPNAENSCLASCDVQAVGVQPVPLTCSHCEDAPCVAACPTGAMHRESEEGPVLLEMERCIGCKACILACPFGMVRLMPNGTAVIKCDLCADRTARGLAPACVAACPTGALELKELDEVVVRARRRAAEARLAADNE